MSKVLFIGKSETEYILQQRFVADLVDNKYDFIDETKTTANGKFIVDYIKTQQRVYSEHGGETNMFHEVWLNKDDILSLAKTIQQIEERKTVGKIPEDLPF